MALLSKTTILIDGEEKQGYDSMNLRQEIDDHHLLEVVFPRHVIESMDDSIGHGGSGLLGKTISLSVEASIDRDSRYGKLVFKGVVAQLRMVNSMHQGGGDKIVVLGKSPTFLVDDGPHCNCYIDKNLSQIVQDIMGSVRDLNLTVSPNLSVPLPYVVQHNQSNFEFISQLAARYGEWCYYDGETFVFGKPGSYEQQLEDHIDLLEYDISLIPIAQLFTYYNRDYREGDISSSSTQATSNNSGFNSITSDRANELFGTNTAVRAYHYGEGSAAILSAISSRQGAAQSINQVVLRGTSDNPGVQLGGVLIIDGTRYRVVQVHHFDDEHGNYQNTFQALAGGNNNDAYPKTNINAFPFSHSELGRVVDTNDPEAQGRIKVKLPWMSGSQETPWLRFLTAHAGSERGQFIVPEVDDEVLVGFEGGNAEAPVILGSLWNLQSKPPPEWTNDQNDFKVFKTRSGHQIQFCDTNGGKSITIEDGEGNSIKIDTASGSIAINAASEITIKSEKITLDASNEMILKSGVKTEMTAGSELTASAPQMSHKADAKMEVQGAVVEVKGSGMTNIDGGAVFIKGKSAITVQAGIVNLN